jgi:hypothetical protein
MILGPRQKSSLCKAKLQDPIQTKKEDTANTV